ncbi:MAG TPA: SIMPL domain-containing protein [Candidatus Magasanikbacteria bacterium]|jgi:hypothetical protein|nr:SIMPL domain-containing protein [Candidatus Magasanikbacteria bacterium]HQF57575.1 SIMPL domain-containing protein [Candidatus Magasanikbacteria bacterium]HQL52407.1 SIMPL domain-containing protein [Candidatus Magasanikbacteria bacterium]
MDYKKTILYSVVILAVALVVGLFIHGYEMGTRAKTNGLTVTGSVKKSVIADLGKWNASFTNRADIRNLKQTLEQNTSIKTKLTNYLKDLGIKEEDINFLTVQINPVYEQLVGWGYTQNIIGYNVVQNVKVQSNDISIIEKLSDQTTDLLNLGIVPDYQNTEYFYTKLNELRPELFAEATKDAYVRAKAMVSGTGSKVGNLINAKTGVIQILPPNSIDISDYGAYDLSTKEKEISATVSVTFALK